MKKLFLYCCLIMPFFTFSQEETNFGKDQLFVGYIAAGMNATQIAGDRMAGYRKVGGNLGVGTFIMYKPFFSNSIEIAYSMRGSQESFKKQDPLTFTKFVFDYVEIPVLFNYHEKDIAIFQAGVTLGRLIRYNLDQTGGLLLPSGEPNKWDISLTAGATFLIQQKFGIQIKGNFSVNSIWSTPVAGSRARKSGWYHNALSIRFVYHFLKKE